MLRSYADKSGVVPFKLKDPHIRKGITVVSRGKWIGTTCK